MARTLRVEGTVVVSVLVDESGQVQEVRMAEPIKQKAGLNEAALSAARSAHYKPATKDWSPGQDVDPPENSFQAMSGPPGLAIRRKRRR